LEKIKIKGSIISTICFKAIWTLSKLLKNQLKQKLEVPFEKEIELKLLNKILFKTRIGQHWFQATF
jgi:hypothetical protein